MATTPALTGGLIGTCSILPTHVTISQFHKENLICIRTCRVRGTLLRSNLRAACGNPDTIVPTNRRLRCQVFFTLASANTNRVHVTVSQQGAVLVATEPGSS